MAHEEQDQIDGWQTYSNWIDELRNNSKVITEYDENPSFKQKFLSSETNLDKFKLLWQDDRVRNEIEIIYKRQLADCISKRQARCGKSIDESKRMRELGNKSFKDGKFMEALNQYTQAIRYALYPINSTTTTTTTNTTTTNQVGSVKRDDSLALALANRSAALYSLTRYRLCLLDIDLAIKYGYPESNIFKLLIRKVKCLHILSVWVNDVEQIKDNLKNMLKSRDTKEFVKVEINNMFEFLEQTQPEDMEKDELDVVDETTMKIPNVSKALANAADCVEMSYASDKGRYLITNKDVSFGRLLVAEEPYVCNLAPAKRNSYCYNCLGRLHSCGLGCSKCTQVLYCSEECLQANFNIHAHECNGFLDFQDKIGVAYLIAHIMFKINFDLKSIPIYTKKTVDKKSLEDVLKITPADWPDLVYKNDYASVLSLMDHSNEFDYDELMGYTLTAIYLMVAFIDNFKNSEKFEVAHNMEQQLVTGSIVLRHLLQLQTNLISILDQNLQGLVSVGHSLSEMQERPIGVGLYPTISLLNHSCSPNILSIFHHNKFIARAASALECGTEINYCYGPSVSRMSKKDRQQRLNEQYFFTCSCDSCTNNNENENRALLCPNCQGPIIHNQDFTHKCLKCSEENIIDVKSYLKQIAEIKSVLDKASASEVILKNLEQKLKNLAFWRHPLFVQIKHQLIESASNADDLRSATEYCEEELELCAKTYGEDSYESIMTKLKLINLKWTFWYYRSEAGDRKADEQIKTLLTKINETRGKLKDLLASTNILGAESSFETEMEFLTNIQNNINEYLATKENISQPEGPLSALQSEAH